MFKKGKTKYCYNIYIYIKSRWVALDQRVAKYLIQRCQLWFSHPMPVTDITNQSRLFPPINLSCDLTALLQMALQAAITNQ